MVQPQAVLSRRSEAHSVVVDLIGDLDATLAGNVAEALHRLRDGGTTDVCVRTRHVAVSSHEGVDALGHALAHARERGCIVAIEPGNRRMHAACAAARIPLGDRWDARATHGRHVMIAHHAPPPRLRRAAR